ncbi:MAG: hypothetical protein DLM69_02795 [Candidatus Chloroheliales bacterium]|nr:MAG: hypothetical protein DLM69_02795 [Chloroflexota bacterium]
MADFLTALVGAHLPLAQTVVVNDLGGLWTEFLTFLPRLIVAIVILIIGLIIASVIRNVVRAGLHRSGLGARIARATGAKDEAQAVAMENTLASLVYYLILLFVIIMVLDSLSLTSVSVPLNGLLSEFLAFIPRLIGAIILAFVAYIVATIVRLVVVNALGAANLDARMSNVSGQAGGMSLTKTIGEIVFYLIFLIFLPGILAALGLDSILAPIGGLVNSILGAIPNIIAAAVLLIIAYFIGTILQRIVSSILRSMGVDSLPQRLGLSRTSAGQAAGQAAQQARVGAAQGVNEVKAEASQSVSQATGGQVNPQVRPTSAPAGGTSLSNIAGYLVLVAILLFAAGEAARLLGFIALSGIIGSLVILLGNVIVALIIFGVGIFLANMVADIINGGGVQQSGLLANFARIAILVLTGTMALRQLGLASDIVNLAFTLGIGALAVAFAVAFGLGGRLPAEHFLEEYRQSVKRNPPNPPPPPPPSASPNLSQNPPPGTGPGL